MLQITYVDHRLNTLESITVMQRSLLLFENSIKSQETLKLYKRSLQRFLEYFKLKDHDSLLAMDKEMLQQMIEDYVIMLKGRGLARETIRTPICATELFCDVNNIQLNFKKMRRLLPERKKRAGDKAYTTDHIKQMLEFTTSVRNKAIIMFLAASGCRIGALMDLKVKHVKDYKLGCKVVTIYPDSKDEYTTFLTPESSRYLDEYLNKRIKDGEYLTPESPLFRQHYSIGIMKARSIKRVTLQFIIDRIVRRAGLRSGNDGKRREIQLDHGFRKRWNTIMKTTDGMKVVLVEKMFGHDITLPLDETYLVPSVDKLFIEYQKAIPELTISGEERQSVIIRRQQNDLDELQKIKIEQEKMKVEMERLKANKN